MLQPSESPNSSLLVGDLSYRLVSSPAVSHAGARAQRTDMNDIMLLAYHTKRGRSVSRRCRHGPPPPNFQKLLKLSGSDQTTVAARLGLDDVAMHNVLHHRVPALERWCPVFAKCTLMARKGLLKLLRYEVDEDTETAASVGETIFRLLERRGDHCVQTCRDYLVSGWRGWEQFKLTEAQVDAFFAGQCTEAEQVADFLVKLGEATDIRNLFCVFTR